MHVFSFINASVDLISIAVLKLEQTSIALAIEVILLINSIAGSFSQALNVPFISIILLVFVLKQVTAKVPSLFI